jgi:hypothetical protein
LPDPFEVAERAPIAIEDGPGPTHAQPSKPEKPGHVSEAERFRAVDDAGRFMDEWAGLALDFEWRPSDIFGPRGLAWFCAGERVRALGPSNAITTSERIFTRTAHGGVGSSKVGGK